MPEGITPLSPPMEGKGSYNRYAKLPGGGVRGQYSRGNGETCEIEARRAYPKRRLLARVVTLRLLR